MPRKTILLVDAEASADGPFEGGATPDELLVVTVSTSAAAMEAAVVQRPVAILIDAALPQASGFSLARQLKAAPATAGIPLIFLTDTQGERAALNAGATALLAKPIDARELHQVVAWLDANTPGRKLLTKAFTHLRAGELEWALESFYETVDSEPGSQVAIWAQYNAGRIHQERKDVQAALEDFAAVVADDPRAWRAHVQIGLVHESMGQADEAAAHWRQALSLRAAQPVIRRRLELLKGGNGKPAPAQAASTSSDTEKITLEDLRRSAAAASDPDTASEPRARPTILVADDSELAVAMIREPLEAAGFNVVCAVNGTEALAMARKERPDVMILDGLMPGMTGFDVCKAVKDDVYPDDPPRVLILSAIYTKQRQKSEAIDIYGVDEVLAKPFDDDKLVATIRKHLAVGRANTARRASGAAEPPRA